MRDLGQRHHRYNAVTKGAVQDSIWWWMVLYILGACWRSWQHIWHKQKHYCISISMNFTRRFWFFFVSWVLAGDPWQHTQHKKTLVSVSVWISHGVFGDMAPLIRVAKLSYPVALGRWTQAISSVSAAQPLHCKHTTSSVRMVHQCLASSLLLL